MTPEELAALMQSGQATPEELAQLHAGLSFTGDPAEARAARDAYVANVERGMATEAVPPAQGVPLTGLPSLPQPVAPPAAPIGADGRPAAIETAFGNAAQALQGTPRVYTGPPTRQVHTTTQGGPVAPETQQAIQANTSAFEQALGDQSAVQKGAFTGQSDTIQQASQESVNEAARQRRVAESQAREMQRRTQAAANINQRVLDGAIDPNRVLGDSMSGGRIAAAIGLWFAGMAQGQQGADAFMGQINHTIDRDIAAQQANMDNLRAAGAAQQNLVGMYRDTLGNEEAGQRAARATMLESVAQRLEAQQARMGADMQDPKLAETIARLHLMASQESAAAQAASQSLVTTQTRVSGGMRGGRDIPAANAYTRLGTAMGNQLDQSQQNATRAQAQANTARANDPAQQWAAVTMGRRDLVPINPTVAPEVRLLAGPQGPLALAQGAESVRDILSRARALRVEAFAEMNPLERRQKFRVLENYQMRAGQSLGNMNKAGAQGDLERAAYQTLAAVPTETEWLRSAALGRDTGLDALDASIAETDNFATQSYRNAGLERQAPAATAPYQPW